MKKIIYSKLSTNRHPDFQIRTRIIHDEVKRVKYVEKTSLVKTSLYTVTMYDNYLFLKEKLKGFNFPISEYDGQAFISEFIEGETLESLFENARDESTRKELFVKFLKCLYFSFDLNFDQHKNIVEHIEFLILEVSSLFSLDLSFSNIIYSDQGLYLIDYEWVDKTSSTEFSFFRTYINSSSNKTGFYFKEYFSEEKFLANSKLEKKFLDNVGYKGEVPTLEKINFEILFSRNEEMKYKIAALEDKIATSEDKIEIIYQSNSWKFTAPLRWIVKKING